MPNLRFVNKSLRTIMLCLFLLVEGGLAVTAAPAAQAGTVPAAERGPALGQRIPAFAARDQFGKEQTLASLTGADGLVLLFVRSADW